MIAARGHDDVARLDLVAARGQELGPLRGQIIAPDVIDRSGTRHRGDQRVHVVERGAHRGEVGMNSLSGEVEHRDAGRLGGDC